MVQFSIIIPVYNAAETIDKCINSIISQTYRSFELLLINDGSTDESLNICQEWQSKDSRIRVFHQKNQGACSARNVGIDNAVGRYIQFVDSDDTITSNCLELIQSIIEKYQDPDIIEYRLNYIGPNNVRNIQGTILEEGLYDRKYLEKEFLPAMLQCEESPDIYYNVFNVLRFIKRELLSNHNIRFDEKIKRWEDMLFAMQVFCYANEMAVTPNALYNYYGHVGGGLGGRYNPCTYKYVKEAYEKLGELFGEKYDLYSPYAIQKKMEQIERCIREIYKNEDTKNRYSIVCEIMTDSFFIDCINRSLSKKGIICVRSYIQKGQTEKAYIKLTNYINISDFRISVRHRLSNVYHWVKGDIKLWISKWKLKNSVRF